MRTFQSAIAIFASLTWMGCDDKDDGVDFNFGTDATRRPETTYSPFSTQPNKVLPPWHNETLSAIGPVNASEIFERVYQEKKFAYNPTYYIDSCNYPRFKIGNELYSLISPFARGSDTRLFLTRDSWYVLKIQDQSGSTYREMFWREHAAMQQARHTGVISVIEPKADLSLMSKECQSRSYVMRKVVGRDLSDYLTASTDKIMEIGREALKILEKFHDTGVIHGDIHPLNFMLGSILDIKGSLKLIDFGRSMSYIDTKTGKHLSESKLKPFNSLTSLNLNLLSINELEGKAISRADDIFRLAEVLITLCYKRIEDFGGLSPRIVAILKRKRTFDSRVPAKLQAFYTYAMNIGFEERPNYKYFD